MKRSILAALPLAFALGCGTDTQTADTGVDAGVEDAGPARDEIPAPPALSATTYDRAGRPYVAKLLLTETATGGDAALYNARAPQPYAPGAELDLGTDEAPTAAGLLIGGLGAYDALDGVCGQGHLTTQSATVAEAYRDLAGLLADDMLWLDTSATRTRCASLLAVERRALGLGEVDDDDCGGRTPDVDALDAMLWLLTSTAAKDGVRAPSGASFADDLPFGAP